jgi:hypothetical protein
MMRMQKLFSAGVLSLAVTAGSPAPAAAQTMICHTITVTTIEYLSNGGQIIDRHSHTVCHPVIT